LAAAWNLIVRLLALLQKLSFGFKSAPLEVPTTRWTLGFVFGQCIEKLARVKKVGEERTSIKLVRKVICKHPR
jgi:hypothetical protein